MLDSPERARERAERHTEYFTSARYFSAPAAAAARCFSSLRLLTPHALHSSSSFIVGCRRHMGVSVAPHHGHSVGRVVPVEPRRLPAPLLVLAFAPRSPFGLADVFDLLREPDALDLPVALAPAFLCRAAGACCASVDTPDDARAKEPAGALFLLASLRACAAITGCSSQEASRASVSSTPAASAASWASCSSPTRPCAAVRPPCARAMCALPGLASPAPRRAIATSRAIAGLCASLAPLVEGFDSSAGRTPATWGIISVTESADEGRAHPAGGLATSACVPAPAPDAAAAGGDTPALSMRAACGCIAASHACSALWVCALAAIAATCSCVTMLPTPASAPRLGMCGSTPLALMPLKAAVSASDSAATCASLPGWGCAIP